MRQPTCRSPRWGRPLFLERRKASGVFISEKFDDAMDSMSDSAKKELVEALTAVVKERRLCAQLLSKPYERGTYEATMARFVELQTTIEAIERALAELVTHLSSSGWTQT